MRQSADFHLISALFFRLLPVQILLAMVSAVNATISGLFAGNFVGADAVSAIGLYSPIYRLIAAVSLVLLSGAQILCGQYMGRNQLQHTQRVFSADLLVAGGFSVFMILLLSVFALTDMTRILAKELSIRRSLNRYILGQVIGILPLVLSQQLTAFLSLENKTRRTTVAGIVYVVVNLALNALFVVVLDMGAFGLVLASSLGSWVFLGIQLQYYLSGRSQLKLRFSGIDKGDGTEIIKMGYPSALSNIYQTLRGFLVNMLITVWAGSAGLSAFAASDSLLVIFWCIPAGIQAVSRMLIGVSIGEEDRRSLADTMRVVLFRCIPLMCAVSAGIMLAAAPLARLFFRDAGTPVYRMTVMAFRILPLCMPLSVISMNFTVYAQASNRQLLVQLISILDGVVNVALFSALLMPLIGMNGVYIANVLNGVVCALTILAYSWLKRHRFPRTVEELMVIPEDFGAGEDARLDISLDEIEEVVTVSRQVVAFCRARGIDERRAFHAGLFLEEMAGNVVDHGFRKDGRKHSVDIRVVHKNDDVILRIKDDCVPFDPKEREGIIDPEDKTKNLGIRLVYRTAREISYQNMLGLNVLTIRI